MADIVDPFKEPEKPQIVDPFDTSADQGAFAAANRGATQGVTFGFGDEINALSQASGWKSEESGLGSLATGAYKYFTGDKEAEQRYNAALARNRLLNKTAQEQHPWAYGGGELAGSLPAMAAMPEASFARVPAFGRAMLKGAQVGAEYGALSGAGEADEGSRLSGAGMGAAEGLIGGAAAPVVTAGIGKVARPIANTVMGAINPERQAAKGVAAALDADQELIRQGKVKGMSEADWMRAKAAGEPVTLADLGGPNTQSLLRSAANASPEARGKIEKIIGDRFEGQSQRVAADVRNLVNGGADAWKTGDQLVADYDAKRTPLYVNAFMQHNAQAVWDDTLEQITQAPSVQNAIRIANVTARNDAARRGMTPMRGSPFVFDDAGRMTLRTDEDGNHTLIPNLQYWDSVKKALDKAGSPEAQQWARILRDHLDTIVPEYGAARGFAANYFGESNALQAGRKLAGKQVDPEIIRRTMAKMDPDERDLFREGYASDWANRVILNFRDTRDVTKAMFNSPNELARAEAVFGPQGVQALKTRMDLERIMDGARQAMGNSTTARQLIEAGLAGAGGAGLGYGIGSMFGEGNGGMGALAGAGLGLHRPGENPLARHAARMLMTGAQAGAQRVSQFVDRGTASRVADLLMSNDPDKRRLGLAAAMKDRRISNALSQIANRMMLAGGFSAGRQFARGGRADFYRARHAFIKKQGGGELSDEDQAAMMPETFVPSPARTFVQQAAPKDVQTLRNIGSGIGNAATSLATLPKRAIEASQDDVQHLGEEGYEPKLTGPALEAASLPMGTGAIAGLRMAPREVALGAGPIRRTYASPEYNPDELHPASISTRLPTGAKATEDPVAQSLTVDTPAMKATPGGLYDTNVDLVRDYPGMKKGLMTGSTDRAAKQFQDQVTDNLLWLHDQVPPEIRERSKLWYDGANKIVKDTAGQYGIPDQSAAGVYAALSPQKDWFQNVSLGKRLIDTYFNKAQAPWSPQMSETVNRIFGEPKYDDMRNAILDTKLSEHEDPIAKAMWIRTYDQAHNSPAHPIVTPEGGFGDVVTTKAGAPARVAWGSLPEIAKGVGSIESGGDPAVLSRLMGEKHKVRSFYNNMLDPMSKRGDVTIDTHAVAAGLLRPLSGNSMEVAHNFQNYPGKGLPSASGSAISGIQGTYPLYADAYRQAAAERGILPREMQSITWEAVRGLFPDTFKTAKNNEAIDNIWKQYGRGRLNLDQARSKIYDLAGGIRNPDWYGR